MSTKPLSEGLLDEKIDKVVKKLYECDGIIRLSNDESRERSLWRGKSGIIYSDITSDGTTGHDWISRLENGGHSIGGERTKRSLCSPNFKETNGVTTGVAILKGGLFDNKDRFLANICNLAIKCNLGMLNPESACLMREKFSNKQISYMGLTSIISVHEGLKDCIYNDELFGLGQFSSYSWLNVYSVRPRDVWNISAGFAFEVL